MVHGCRRIVSCGSNFDLLYTQSVPLLRVVRDMERLSVRAPCFCCCEGRTREEVLEEQASLVEKLEQEELINADTHAFQADDKVQSSFTSSIHASPPTTNATIAHSGITIDGKKYFQDRDSGTVTLQDQINVSYGNWMKAEASYQRTLDQFKLECEAAGFDYREVRSMNGENIASTVEDYEVRRLWTMLDALENNTKRAKRDLDKFQAELDRLTLPPVSEKKHIHKIRILCNPS